MHDLLRIQALNGRFDALGKLGLVNKSGWNVHEVIISRSAEARRPRLVGKGRVIRPKSAQETGVLRFDSKLVVNGVAQLLFTAQITLCRLNGHVAE